MFRKFPQLFLGCVLFLAVHSSAQAAVHVVSTIRPLAMIAKAVVGDNATVDVLIEAQDDAHHYTLSPSDRLAIERADLLLWVGPEFEVYLTTMMQRLDEASLITAMTLPDMTLHPLDAQTIDPHIWLDPHNARVIAEALVAAISQQDPANSDYYASNLQDFIAELEQAERTIVQDLAGMPETAIAVYHNAYQYLEQRFGLTHAIALVDNPEVAPGIQQVLRVQNSIRDIQPACVLLDPEHSPALVETLMGDSTALRLQIDVLGYDQQAAVSTAVDDASSASADAASYIALLRTIVSGYLQCAGQSLSNN
jgi:zinc transport system substrate-binding protein